MKSLWLPSSHLSLCIGQAVQDFLVGHENHVITGPLTFTPQSLPGLGPNPDQRTGKHKFGSHWTWSQMRATSSHTFVGARERE
jgi:hypothetical protein